MKENKSNYQEWLEKAEEDGIAGEELLEGARVFGPACFHFQQMAEKYLKALLINSDNNFPKTHDLIALAALIEDNFPEIKEHREDFELLNSYYIETRYPGDFPEFNLKETQEAREAAYTIKEFVLGKIKK